MPGFIDFLQFSGPLVDRQCLGQIPREIGVIASISKPLGRFDQDRAEGLFLLGDNPKDTAHMCILSEFDDDFYPRNKVYHRDKAQ